MAVQFLGDKPWPKISTTLRRRGPRRVAVAFLGIDGPHLLRHLAAGDKLVINASREAVASHATSPAAIHTLQSRGVDVRSLAELHAKVFVTAEWAIVGSANASANSQRSSEAMILTDQKTVVREARTFVEDTLRDADPISAARLDELRRVWDENARAAVPGVTGTSAETALVKGIRPNGILVHTVDGDLTDEERREIEESVEQIPKFQTWAMQLQDDDAGFSMNTALFLCSSGDVSAPVVTYAAAAGPIPHRDSGRYQLVRSQRGLRSRTTTTLRRALGTQRLREEFDSAVDNEDADSIKLSRELTSELLGAWKLKIT